MSSRNNQKKSVIITGYGGISAAGRSSFEHGYHRIIFDALNVKQQQSTLQSLAQVMGLQHIDSSNKNHVQNILSSRDRKSVV